MQPNSHKYGNQKAAVGPESGAGSCCLNRLCFLVCCRRQRFCRAPSIALFFFGSFCLFKQIHSKIKDDDWFPSCKWCLSRSLTCALCFWCQAALPPLRHGRLRGPSLRQVPGGEAPERPFLAVPSFSILRHHSLQGQNPGKMGGVQSERWVMGNQTFDPCLTS